MGSGELTSTMVEVHKELLAGLADSPKAVFLDTPAGNGNAGIGSKISLPIAAIPIPEK